MIMNQNDNENCNIYNLGDESMMLSNYNVI